MTDDCGDMFDESECSGSSQVAFENGEAGDVLLLSPPDDQSTSRYWNVTKPLDTDWKENAGAAFDHTQMTEYGYYAVVSTAAAEGMAANETSWMASDWVTPESGACEVAFYYHFQGEGGITLTIYEQ